MVCADCVRCPFDNPNIPSDAHEIHITVEDANVGEFSAMCGLLGHKPVLIAMQDDAGATFHHMMSSYSIRGSEAEASNVAERHADLFRGKGFNVSRVKIETTTKNVICFERTPDDGRYYEAHIQIKVPDSEDRWDTVGNVSGIDSRLKLSKNAFKRAEPNSYHAWYFVTIRIANLWRPQDFEYLVKQISHKLADHYEIGKVRMEFAWHDSNIEQDKDWK